MKAIIVMAAGALLMGALRPTPADAWASANRWGGSTTHSWGSTSHTNAWGGSSYHAYGQGTEHTNMYGGSTAHAYGGGTEHTNVYGGSTYGAYGAGVGHTYPNGATAYHPPGYGYGYGYRGYSGYSAYHPPVAVPTMRGPVVMAVPRQPAPLSALPQGPRWPPPPQQWQPPTPTMRGWQVLRTHTPWGQTMRCCRLAA